MAKVITIAENLKAENAKGIDYWECARKEYEYKTTALCTLDKKVLLAIGEMMNRTMQVDGNFVFSPVALYLALISLAKITDGNTRKQIVDMLGITEKDLLGVYGALNCVASNSTPMATSSISSALWINNRMDYNEELLLQLNKDLHLVSYAGEMGTDEMDAQIAEWINKTTGNMLADSVKIKTTQDTLLELLTTIYFRSMWDHDFDAEDTMPGSFYLADGNKVRCKFMNQWIRTAYHTGTKFTAITKALNAGYDTLYLRMIRK